MKACRSDLSLDYMVNFIHMLPTLHWSLVDKANTESCLLDRYRSLVHMESNSILSSILPDSNDSVVNSQLTLFWEIGNNDYKESSNVWAKLTDICVSSFRAGNARWACMNEREVQDRPHTITHLLYSRLFLGPTETDKCSRRMRYQTELKSRHRNIQSELGPAIAEWSAASGGELRCCSLCTVTPLHACDFCIAIYG